LGLSLAACLCLSAETIPLLETMRSELERNFAVLKEKADPAVYFLAYTVTETEAHTIAATMGSLQRNASSTSRVLDVNVRVGSPKLDNYHRMSGENPHFANASAVPVDDTPDGIRRAMWLETDRIYRAAAQRLIQIKTNSKVNVAGNDDSDDFSIEKPVTAVEDVPRLQFNAAAWEGIARRTSAGFSKYSGALSSNVTVVAQREIKYFVNSEGTVLRHGRNFARVMIVARGKAFDGMELATTDSFEAEDPSGLPNEAALLAAVDHAGRDLEALLKAPVVEPYLGPAILSGKASGVFFHEIFGHRIEGHRQRDESEGQTFTKSLNAPILPEFLSVVFDPTLHRAGKVDLNGWYDYDDEGVKARPVTLVENGILKTFLMSRTPIQGFPASNGHGRKQAGVDAVSRQSNLIVQSNRAVSDARLREMLIEEVKKAGKPYGLYFDAITGGYTTTSRRGLQAFKVIPLVVYRVYPDGRPDELVRGADIVGTPLSSFAKILATSDKADVFNGYCGAESGSIPVSAVSPAILVSELEIQKTEQSQERPPLLPRPRTETRP
jgi:predicted Zn-dependent protease